MNKTGLCPKAVTPDLCCPVLSREDLIKNAGTWFPPPDIQMEWAWGATWA